MIIGDKFLIKGGKRLPKGSRYSESKTPYRYIRVKDLRRGGVDPLGVKYISKDIQEQIKRYTISSDDVFITIAGTIGVTGVIPSELSGSNLTENAAKMVAKAETEFDPAYLSYYLNSPAIQSEIEKKTRAVGVPKLALFRIAELPLYLPSLPEQRAIAARLDAADRLRQLDKALVEKYDELKRSLFLEMFGDPVLNEMGWEVAPLSTHIDIIHGFAFKSEHFTYEPGPILLTPGNFEDEGGFKDRGEKQRYYDGEYPEAYQLSSGDVLVAMTEQAAGLLGSTLIVPNDGVYLHNQRLGRLELRTKRMELHFVANLFNCDTFRTVVAESSTGSKVKHTSPKKLMSIETIVPPVELQRQYLTKIASLNRQQSLARRALGCSEDLFQGVLGEVFG